MSRWSNKSVGSGEEKRHEKEMDKSGQWMLKHAADYGDINRM